jgi:DNA-directed RNA polymerase III subunit RPC11
MLYFCQHCGNRLRLEEGNVCFRFSCPTCPFVFNVKRKLSSKYFPKLKQVDEVLSDAAMWENVDSTDEKCPKCTYQTLSFDLLSISVLILVWPNRRWSGNHPRAYFMQIQTRSADEPMTTFYRCCSIECQYKWKEG